MDNFTLYLQVQLQPMPGKSHLRSVYVQYLENFNPNTETGNQIDTYLTCHKDAISVVYSDNFVEINIKGKKQYGFTTGNMFFDGNSIGIFPCQNVGFQLSNSI